MVEISIWIPVVGFWILQNNYFGWNGFPESYPELMADGITLILLMIAIITTLALGSK